MGETGNGEKIQTGCVQCPLVLPPSCALARPSHVRPSKACNGNDGRPCACALHRVDHRIYEGEKDAPVAPKRRTSSFYPERSCGRRVLTPLWYRLPLCVSAAATVGRSVGGGRNDWWTLRRVRRRGDPARQSCGGRRTERYGPRRRRSRYFAFSLCLSVYRRRYPSYAPSRNYRFISVSPVVAESPRSLALRSENGLPNGLPNGPRSRIGAHSLDIGREIV